MKPYLRINLSVEDAAALKDLYEKGSKHHLRQKSQALLLSNSGKVVPEIAHFFSRQEDTIRSWFKSWLNLGLVGLEVKKGRGKKASLSVEDSTTVDIVKKK